MRVLYVPFFSNLANHNGCSIFNTMKHFFRAWVEADESVYIYFPVPNNIKFDGDDTLNHERIELIPVPLLGNDQYDEKVLIPSEIYSLFNTDNGKYYYDVVISDKAQVANALKLMLNRKFRVGAYDLVPYITLTQFIVVKSGRFEDMMDEYEFSHILGWLSGFNLFENERNAQKCFNLAKKYLQPAYVKKIIEHSKVQNVFGLNTKKLDTYYKGNSYVDGGEIRINFAHRAASHYKFEDVLDVVDYLFKSGLPIKFVLTTPSNNLGKYAMVRMKEMRRIGLNMEVYKGLPQEQFYKIASGCHLFIEMIDELQSPNAMMEQMYLGQVGILPDFEWVHHFFPNYPYIARNRNEVMVWIKDFLKNPKQFIDTINVERERLKLEYDIYVNSVKLLKWLKSDIIPMFLPYEKSVEMVKEILDKEGNPDSFTIDELARMFKEHTEFAVDIFKPTFKKLNKFDFIKAVLSLGYRDTNKSVLSFEKYDIIEK